MILFIEPALSQASFKGEKVYLDLTSIITGNNTLQQVTTGKQMKHKTQNRMLEIQNKNRID